MNKLDPERLNPLLELPPPTTRSALQRILGMFAYYANWIPQFSDRARPFFKRSFSMSPDEFEAYKKIQEKTWQ